MQRAQFLFLESFFGGSHKAFAEGLAKHTTHTIDLITLPAAYWRWRTRTGALQFADRVAKLRNAAPPSVDTDARPLRLSEYDGIVATDLMDLGDLRALLAGPPILLYVHESQSSYPRPDGSPADTDTVMRDVRNAVFADRVLFNSHFHRNHFLEVATELAAQTPQAGLTPIVASIRDKSDVLYPGCTLSDLSPPGGGPAVPDSPGGGPAVPDSPLIIWNHRWEYDKNPVPFFRTLKTLSEEGLGFRVAVVGEQPDYIPREFTDAYTALSGHIVTWGYLERREDYARLLLSGDIVVSTSMQENFGISIVEAAAAGCVPLVPKRLSYPEIIPQEYHDLCLYTSNAQLVSRLRAFLTNGVPRAAGLREAMFGYEWSQMSGAYDRELEALRRLTRH
ncbi:MAG: tRNA-queuosine alpha-mannosyltransferase domain-containing protein [Spirochaetota bacterium]